MAVWSGEWVPVTEMSVKLNHLIKTTISSHWKMTKGRRNLRRVYSWKPPLHCVSLVTRWHSCLGASPAQLPLLEVVVWVKDGQWTSSNKALWEVRETKKGREKVSAHLWLAATAHVLKQTAESPATTISPGICTRTQVDVGPQRPSGHSLKEQISTPWRTHVREHHATDRSYHLNAHMYNRMDKSEHIWGIIIIIIIIIVSSNTWNSLGAPGIGDFSNVFLYIKLISLSQP